MFNNIYEEGTERASENFVIVAKACHGLLAKQHFTNGETKSYDRVKYFDFYEREVWSLGELYSLSKRLLSNPKCCVIRARLKDANKRKHMLRRAYDSATGDATLICSPCNWFAMDIDGYGISMNNLETDIHQVLLALPHVFSDTECFAVASASYGIKSSIHLRLFFWAQHPVSGVDLSKFLRGNKANADLAIFNPVQVIYTAAPVFHSGVDPVKQRMLWIHGNALSVNIPYEERNRKGDAEIVYSKQQADRQAAKYYGEIAKLSYGERHNGVMKWCFPLGKLIGQGHFEREEVIEIVFNHCSFWSGKRDTVKDRQTITYAIDRGINSMDVGVTNEVTGAEDHD